MIYLDNAATSFPKPESVYQTLDRFARTALANPGQNILEIGRAVRLGQAAFAQLLRLVQQFFIIETPAQMVQVRLAPLGMQAVQSLQQ